jgi:hypothetical protein
LALTSPTSGGRSVGIVRLWTTGHGIYFVHLQLAYVTFCGVAVSGNYIGL